MERIAKSIKRYRPDWIVAIVRGGLAPTAILAQAIGQRAVDTICISSYEGHKQSQMRKIWKPFDHLRGERILLVDDICCTGATFMSAIAHLKKWQPDEIRTAAIHLKVGSNFVLDFYCEKIADECRIKYPWEKCG